MSGNATERNVDGLLDSGLARMSLPLEPSVRAALLEYVDLLARWNRSYNLTAIREPEKMISHHLLDSLAVVQPLARSIKHPAAVIDVGSGGGLPGVVLALVWPQIPVVLVEPVSKKCAFLRQVAAQLGLANLTVLAQRIQHVLPAELPGRDRGPQLFISRAYTRLVDYARQILPLCTDGCVVAAMKSAQVAQEVSEVSTDESLIRVVSSAAGATAVELQIDKVHDLVVPGIDAPRSLVILQARERAWPTPQAVSPDSGSI